MARLLGRYTSGEVSAAKVGVVLSGHAVGVV